MKTKHEHIAEIAYFLWLNRGKPTGKDLEIWYEAEQIYNITSSGFKSKDVSKANVKAKKTTAKTSTKKTATKTKTAVAKTKVAKAEKKETKNEVKKEIKKDVATETKKTSIKVSLKPTTKKTIAKKSTKKVEVAKIIPILKPKVALSRGITPKSIKVVVKSAK